MSRFFINDEEWQALMGLPHLPYRLYIALRRRMDFRTGLVGARPKVNYQALREDLYIEPCQGRTGEESGSPTQDAVRYGLKMLVRVGLLKVIPADRQLIFSLILADTQQSRTVEVHQSSTRATPDQAYQSESELNQGLQPDLHQSSTRAKSEEVPQASENGDTEKKQKPSSIEFSSSSETVPSRARGAGDDDATAADEIISAVPVTARQWWLLVIQAGFTPAQAGQEKAVALYRQWVDLRVTQAEFDAALVRAIAAKSGLPASPVYLAAIVQQVRSEVVAPMVNLGQGRSAGGGDKPWFVAGDYPVGDKSKAAPHLAGLKQQLRLQ